MPDSSLIPFRKVHGLGNDFVLIDAIERPGLADLPWGGLARAFCDRHTGVGADGVLVLTAAEGADAAMRIVNSDGSDGGMCGNGVRCVARHLYERHGARGEVSVRVGERHVRIGIDAPGGAFRAATVNMGLPRVSTEVPEDVLLAADRASPGWRDSCGFDRMLGLVEMPNPHVVLACREAERVPLSEVGPAIERHEAFPGRTNVQFAQVVNPGHARVRTWERGSGATLACGTGACAVVVACATAGLLGRDATVTLAGGDLRVRWEDSHAVQMTGPAEHVFDGVWTPR